MSYRLSVMAAKCHVGSATAKAVLRCLCDHANEKGSCVVSLSEIADETECCRNTILKVIADLHASGWIAIGIESGRANEYLITKKIEAEFSALPAARCQQ